MGTEFATQSWIQEHDL